MIQFDSKKGKVRMKKIIIPGIIALITITLTVFLYKENNKEIKELKTQKKSNIRVIEVVEKEEKEKIEVTENDIVNYINEIEEEIEEIEYIEDNDSNTKEKLKEQFIILTDFIFYDGTIKGKTFKELSVEAKEKIINLYEKLDSKIESIYPNYKEEIKDTSTKIYSKAKEKTILLKEYLKKNYIDLIGEDAYQKEIEVIENTKENIKEKATPIINTTKEKTKEVYENTKDKLNTWYQGIKESS